MIAVVASVLGLEAGGQEPGEMSTKNVPFTLKVERNEVPVRVVVRDRDGRPVRNLTKDDFHILDNGKPQVITQFSTESAGSAPAQAPVAEKPGAEKPTPTIAPKIANRFVALYFDDLVMDFESIVRSRDAVSKYLQTSVQAADRVGIFTSSGQGNLDFTADRDKLQEALSHLHPVGIYAKIGRDCPDLSDYEAYLIDETRDQQALDIATQKVINCLCNGDSQHCPDPVGQAQMAARIRWGVAQAQAVSSLRGLNDLVRRLSVLPGQRAIVFVSRGFLSMTQNQMISGIIDRAVRAGVIVNSLDARGLYAVIPGGDASESGSGLTGSFSGQLIQMQFAAAQQDADVMAEFADGTGGVFFHNNNDLDAGIRAAGGLAEFSYILVFSPSDLKPNGKYHRLKVSLTGGAKNARLTVQARRGYFASVGSQSPQQREEEEITDAIYSRDELNSSRLRIGTRFFKTSPLEAQVTIVAHLDTQSLSFRTESERHVDDVTFVTVLFDSDGNFVQGLKKSVAMHLRDVTLEKMRAAGISMTSNFTVPPGTYLVREVVRDEGGVISSMSDTMEIPY